MNANENREDQVMAAISHAGLFLPLVGTILPLGIWLSQKDRSPLLRFQALQALIYQGLGLLAYIGLTVCQFAGSMAFFPIMIIPAAIFSEAPNESAPVIGVILMLGMILFTIIAMLINLLTCILGPVYLVLGAWAAWQVLNGRDFHYPIIGRWLTKRVTT